MRKIFLGNIREVEVVLVEDDSGLASLIIQAAFSMWIGLRLDYQRVRAPAVMSSTA